MVKQLQIFKLQIQPLRPLPDIFHAGLDLLQVITLVFRETIYELDQTMYNFIVAKIQNVMLQMQYIVNLLYLNKVTSQNIFVSDYLNPDLYPVQEIAPVFSKNSKFFTSLQCELEHRSQQIVVYSNLPPYPSADLSSKKIVVSSDLVPDLDPVQAIAPVFLFLFICFTLKVCGTKTEHSDVDTYGGRIHVYIYFQVWFEQWTVATYGGISKLFIVHIRFYLFFRFTDKVRGTKTEHSDVATYGRIIHVYIFSRTVISLMSHLLTADNRPGFLWNVDTYAFVYLLRSDQYVSNQYILDRNTRLSSYMIGVTYSDYISLLLVCGYFPLTSKRGVCCNLLESTPSRIPLIKSGHKWTQILFIISNSKLGIWICSQPRIDLNSQSNFYYVLTRPYKYLVQHTIKTLYKNNML